ncbi:MAG TPA: Cof-type HAD-IIB family hydrolase [Caulobacteraceae bacterium]|nr:Cof-type HAD-IIB family hydrolase [Caulobacteraceae bacterium]
MSEIGDIRLLLSDVDGTLVDQDKRLTPAAVAAAEQLRDAGIDLSVTSARPPRGLSMLVEPLGLTLPMAGFNGGLIVRPDLSVIESHPIDPGLARKAVDLLTGQGLDVWLYTDADWFVSDPKGEHVDREAWILQFDPIPATNFTADQLAGAYKIVGVSKDIAKVAATAPLAQDVLGAGVSATQSEPKFIDITSARATKGFVVKSLAKHLGLTPAQVGTIGDMPNDVLMFRESGFSIAMGNASDEVKAQASALTDTNRQDGFAKAVRRFLLKDRAA